MKREVIVLAGGKGKRLRSVVSHTPKPMALVNGIPFLEILVRHLIRNNFDRIILSLGFEHEKIINYFDSIELDTEIVYSIEDEPQGTGGAMKLAFLHTIKSPVFIINGDTFVDIDYDRVESQYADNKKSIICGVHIDNVSRYGSIIYKNNKIIGFNEKGGIGSGVINSGNYYIDHNELIEFAIDDKFSFEDDYLCKKKYFSKLELCIFEGAFIDIGIPEDYHKSGRILEKFI
jgi:D-glycero-alpha-D-manno-heptose 1-phosphate guanylyltransferase